MNSPNRILILFAHPVLEKYRVNRRLIHAVKALDNVTFHDLYEAYPNLHIQVKFEQKLLLSHDIIVFQHPFYWYSSPAILKEWQDLVLEYGFAYGHHGNALQGKKFLSVITTDGSEEAYQPEGHNYFTIQQLLVPFEQTARLCGMEYLPPFVVYGTPHLDIPQIDQNAKDYARAIAALRDNTVDWKYLKKVKHFNQNLGRLIKSSQGTENAY
jgi:glutathione-regulated potassium-efflux system ancillary protein KefG